MASFCILIGSIIVHAEVQSQPDVLHLDVSKSTNLEVGQDVAECQDVAGG